MRAVVTGGSGFIGSALVLHLVKELGWSVLNFDALTYAGNTQSLTGAAKASNYSFVRGDVCDFAHFSRCIQEYQPGVILHLAAETHVDRSISGPNVFTRTNVLGTHAVLEAARAYWEALSRPRKEAFRLLHVSTDEVYGSLGPEGYFTEQSRYEPRSPYSASKAASDHLVRAWGETYGLPVLISNCSNNYGPRQFPEKLIPLMILNALHGKSLPVYGDGLNRRDWIHVEDHARALVAIVTHGRAGETYLVGARSEQSNLDVVHALCAALDRAIPAGAPHDQLITYVADRPGHDRRYAIDPTKVETETGWRPQHPLASGLEQTVAWYLANRSWWEPLRQDVYAGQRLGLLGTV